MNEKEFDDKIRIGIKDPNNGTPAWSRMATILNADLPLGDFTEFDKVIQKDLNNLQTNNTSNWDRMESIISSDPTLLNNSFDSNIAAKVASLDAIHLGSPNWDRMESALDLPMSLEESDMVLAAKILSFTPSKTPQWGKFEQKLEEDLPLTKERNLFDNQLKRALTGLAVTQTPNWEGMNFALDSDAVLGSTASFDQRIKDAVDQPGTGSSSDNWSSVKSSLDLLDQRRVRIFGSKTLELSMMLLLLVTTPFLLTWLDNDSSPTVPESIEETKKVITADSESAIKNTNPTGVKKIVASSNNSSNISKDNTAIKEGARIGSSAAVLPNNTGSNNTSDAGTLTRMVVDNSIAASKLNTPNYLSERLEKELIVLLDHIEKDALLAAKSNENDNLSNTFDGLPLKTLLIDRNYSIDGLISNFSLSKDLLKPSSKWRPYVSAFVGTQVIDLKLQNLDATYELVADKKFAPNGGVAVGFSNGKLDLSVGLGRMQLNYAGGASRDDAFYLDTLPSLRISLWNIGYGNSNISAYIVPISAKIYLPLENNKLNLYINAGLTGTKIIEAPTEKAAKFVRWITDPPPVGGPLNPPVVKVGQKKTNEYFVEARFGVGLSYNITNRISVFSDLNLDIPLRDKSIGDYKDTWRSYNLGVGVQYFLK